MAETPIPATYLSPSTFSVAVDKAAEFPAGVRVQANCGVDGYRLGTSTGYAGTTIGLSWDADGLTANLVDVLHGNDTPDSLCHHAALHAAGGRDPITPTGIGALSTAGGAMEGTAVLKAWQETEVSLGSISGAVEIDLSLGCKFIATIAGATTISFKSSSIPPPGKTTGVVFDFTNPGTNLTWPTGMRWPSGVIPTFTASGMDRISVEVPGSGTPGGVLSIKDWK